MGLPIAIAEGILIALGVLVGGYYVLQVLSFFGEIAIEEFRRSRSVHGPKISNYRRYRTEEGRRQLWRELRVYVYVAVGVIVFVAACLIDALLHSQKT